MNMAKQLMKEYVVALSALGIGCLFLLIGLNGGTIASITSRPMNSSSWETSFAAINTWTYIPIGLGITFLLAALFAFTIKYYVQQLQQVKNV